MNNKVVMGTEVTSEQEYVQPPGSGINFPITKIVEVNS